MGPFSGGKGMAGKKQGGGGEVRGSMDHTPLQPVPGSEKCSMMTIWLFRYYKQRDRHTEVRRLTTWSRVRWWGGRRGLRACVHGAVFWPSHAPCSSTYYTPTTNLHKALPLWHTDRQTDRQTERETMVQSLAPCSSTYYTPTINHHKPLPLSDKALKALHTLKKLQVAQTRLTSVGFRSWSAVSLQMTWVINPAVVCHYFPPGLQLPPQPLRGLIPILLLGEQRNNGCEQFA